MLFVFFSGSAHFLCSCRFKLSIIMFLANLVLYLNRVNINMVVVCMLDVTEQYDVVTMATDSDTHYNTNATHEEFYVGGDLPDLKTEPRRQIFDKSTESTNLSSYEHSPHQHNMTDGKHRHVSEVCSELYG